MPKSSARTQRPVVQKIQNFADAMAELMDDPDCPSPVWHQLCNVYCELSEAAQRVDAARLTRAQIRTAMPQILEILFTKPGA